MDKDTLWNNFLKVIKNKLMSVSYDTWFKDTKLYSMEDDKLVIEVPMSFHKTFLSTTYYDLIEEIITSLTGNTYDLEFLIHEEIDEKKQVTRSLDDISNKERNFNSNLNPKYKFENFVIGDSNRFAQTAAVAVAEQPGKIYNPLFIHGKSGLGKTHLMHAVGNYIVDHSDLNVLYVTSEEFISDFIGINKKNTDNYDIVDHFKEKYRNIDVLIIDDIQFLGGATQTQQEFFNTFNDLYDDNKQIIISSDRSPDDLKKLEDRLRTRFNWGLSVNIYPPDYEMRIEILKKKIIGQNMTGTISDDVVAYIANNCDSDVRQLEGALTRVIAYATMFNTQDIDLNLAIDALKDYLSKASFTKNNIQKIQQVVAEYYNITVEDLKSKKRKASIAFPRQIAIYLCRTLTNESFPKIGIQFGGRDHSTVMHSVDKIENELKTNPQFKNILENLKSKI